MAFRSLTTRGKLRLCGAVLFIIALPAGAQTISFVDASEEAGLRTAGVGYGAAVHDYDRDGWDDIFITTLNGSSRLFRNDGDATFTDVTAEVGLAGIGAYAAALWGDIDNDGLTDLFLGRGAAGSSRLFRNVGDGVFEDISEASGLDLGAPIATAAFGDVNGDGAIDLFLAVHNGLDLLYRNRAGAGDAVFEDVSRAAGIGGPAHAVPMQATWVDYDRDGDLDLYCVHDGRAESRLYENDESWPFRDVAFASRISTYPDGSVCCNMGTAWGDFDGDGWIDAYVTRIGKGGLYRNNRDGTFTDEAEERGAARNGMSWGVVWLDAENDGDLDLFIVSTSGYDGTPTLLYENEDGVFTEIGRDAGASFRVDARGLASGDFNRDGLADLVIVSTDGRHRLLLNESKSTGHWVNVNLHGRNVNAGAIGTRVEVVAAGRRAVRTVSGGDSYASQSSSTLHFGLGEATEIDTLRILWTSDEVQEMTSLAVDRSYTIMEGVFTQSIPPPEAPLAALTLDAIYPNPARDALHVNFFIADSGPVQIDLHDVVGRRVAILANDNLQRGSHVRVFESATLPSGSYFIRLISGGVGVVRGVMIAK